MKQTRYQPALLDFPRGSFLSGWQFPAMSIPPAPRVRTGYPYPIRLIRLIRYFFAEGALGRPTPHLQAGC